MLGVVYAIEICFDRSGVSPPVNLEQNHEVVDPAGLVQFLPILGQIPTSTRGSPFVYACTYNQPVLGILGMGELSNQSVALGSIGDYRAVGFSVYAMW